MTIELITITTNVDTVNVYFFIWSLFKIMIIKFTMQELKITSIVVLERWLFPMYICFNFLYFKCWNIYNSILARNLDPRRWHHDNQFKIEQVGVSLDIICKYREDPRIGLVNICKMKNILLFQSKDMTTLIDFEQTLIYVPISRGAGAMSFREAYVICCLTRSRIRTPAPSPIPSKFWLEKNISYFQKKTGCVYFCQKCLKHPI